VVDVDNLVNLERYTDAVERLSSCGYAVSSTGQGHMVIHRTDGDDVSRCDNLAQLVDLADLFEWREQRKALCVL